MPDDEKRNAQYVRSLPDLEMTPEMAALRAAIGTLESALSTSDLRELKRLLARVFLHVTLDERQLSRREWLADIQRQQIFCRYDKLDIVDTKIDGSIASGRQIDHFDQGWTRINGIRLQ